MHGKIACPKTYGGPCMKQGINMKWAINGVWKFSIITVSVTFVPGFPFSIKVTNGSTYPQLTGLWLKLINFQTSVLLIKPSNLPTPWRSKNQLHSLPFLKFLVFYFNNCLYCVFYDKMRGNLRRSSSLYSRHVILNHL